MTIFAKSAPTKPGVLAAMTLKSTARRQFYFLGVKLEDFLPAFHVGPVDQHLAIESPRAQQRRIENLRPVGRRHHDHVFVWIEAVHFGEQLIERLLALVVAAEACSCRALCRAHRARR